MKKRIGLLILLVLMTIGTALVATESVGALEAASTKAEKPDPRGGGPGRP